MMVAIDSVEARVIGSLVEKQLSTPQQYPLTLNALTLACNQASNREPVVNYGEEQVQVALDSLKQKGLVRFVLPSHGRSVVRYRHVLDERLALDERQLAVVAVLLLRGAQTAGELRTRTERMARFDSTPQVESDLEGLARWDEPLVVRLPRRPGQKEDRWIQLMAPTGEPATGEPATAEPALLEAADHSASAGWREAVEELQRDIALLREEVLELRLELAEWADRGEGAR